MSSIINEIVGKLKEGSRSPLSRDPSEAVISINRLTGKAGTWYEKMRYLLDYQEERFIKRSAVERILRRKILFGSDTGVGLTLLQELIRGGYLPNNEIPERVAKDIDAIIAKYRLLFRLASPEGHSALSFERWTTSLAATEIYRMLFPAPGAEYATEGMFSYVQQSITLTPQPTEQDATIQIYIACRRSILKETDEELSYALWRRFVPDWSTISSEESGLMTEIAKNVLEIRKKIKQSIEHRLSWRITRKLKNYGIYFSIIRELTDLYGGEINKFLEDQSALDHEITRILDKRYTNEHRKAFSSGVHAVFYIFCTKMLVAILLELPYDYFIVQEINYLAIGINIIFHPVLLFLMVSTIPKLGKENTAYILTGVRKIITGELPAPIRITTTPSASTFNNIFTSLYFILFVICFGFIIAVLNLLSFNIASITLFLFFLTLISYFGLRIRYTASEWKVLADTETTAGLLWSLLTLPVIRVGRRLTKAFSSINVFVLVMDFLIEAPFKLLLHVFDAFLWFLKEKREEIH